MSWYSWVGWWNLKSKNLLEFCSKIKSVRAFFCETVKQARLAKERLGRRSSSRASRVFNRNREKKGLKSLLLLRFYTSFFLISLVLLPSLIAKLFASSSYAIFSRLPLLLHIDFSLHLIIIIINYKFSQCFLDLRAHYIHGSFYSSLVLFFFG